MHEQVAVGLARRIVKIHELPYIVGINPHMQIVYTLYVDAFTKLIKLKPPKTIAQQNKMTEDIFYDLLTGTRQVFDDVISRAHGRRKRAQQAAVPRSRCCVLHGALAWVFCPCRAPPTLPLSRSRAAGCG